MRKKARDKSKKDQLLIQEVEDMISEGGPMQPGYTDPYQLDKLPKKKKQKHK